MPLGPKDVPGIVSRVDPRQLTKRGEPVIRNSIVAFGQDMLQELINDATFSTRDPRVVEFLRQWGAERITGMVNETTKDRIQTALINGIERGSTTTEIADAIDGIFTARSSSLTIARTEITRASNFGALEGIRQGGAERKEWLSTQDGDVRDTADASHVALDGQVVGLDELFVDPMNGAGAPYPGEFGLPEEDINCRCGVLPVFDERQLRQFARRRFRVWKILERKRSPWQKKLRRALAEGFDAQRTDVLAALEAAAA